MPTSYLFQSKRIGFRNWRRSDLPEFAEMNADEAVMEHFPKPLTETESADFIERLMTHYEKHCYSYFAAELLDCGELIGFIGLAYQQYESEFTPATDIGWRLKTAAWGKGLATEGAQRCLEFAFDDLGLERVISTCPLRNHKSEGVMKKIGMEKIGTFRHPNLKDYPDLEQCACYAIEKKS